MISSVDDRLANLAHGHGLVFVLVVAFVLGLRHASDPDHLVAVSTLVAGMRERATRAAAVLGAAWGAGHATTLVVFGVPVILVHAYVPSVVEKLAETLIGTIIVVLAIRLLVRWRRGAFHVHEHAHAHAPEGERHRHLHDHGDSHNHAHRHVIRSPAQAFAIGLVHGAAGSGAVAVLIVAAVPTRSAALLALLVLLTGTAISMSLLSAAAGRALGAERLQRRFAAAVPLLGSAALTFGAWYTASALQSI